MLFGPHMKMYPFPPEWFPRKVMSSALGASLFSLISAGMKMYAPQPRTLRWSMSGRTSAVT